MTLTGTYNSDLSRVQLVLDALRADSRVTVERSTNQLFWQTARGGVSLLLDGTGDGSLDDYEFAADVLNFYRVRPVDPAAGLLLPGASGDYASTPDAVALDIIGDIDLRAEATLDDWTAASDQTLIAKWTNTGNQRSYRLMADTTGALQINWSTDGTAVVTRLSTELIPVVDGGRIAVRATLDVNNGASGHTVTFYTASSIEGPWTQLGIPVVNAGTTSVFSSSAILEAGSTNVGTAERAAGVIHAARVLNGIAGTEVANPDFDQQTDLDISFADVAGHTWTVNGNASIVGEVLDTHSLTPSLAGAVWLKSIRHPFLNRVVHVAELDYVDRRFRGRIDDVSGRSNPTAVTDLRGGQQFPLLIRVDTFETARDMDLILASGDTFFIHVPPECPLAVGGYVTIGDTRQRRAGRKGRYHFDLPCTVVNPPGPDVVGTTLTWGTVLNTYGSWTALLAANSTWADLLATVGSAEDLVVI